MESSAHAALMKALWADTAFLAGQGVMDYSLIVGVDMPNGALIVGIIDFLRQVQCPLHFAHISREVVCHCESIAALMFCSMRAVDGYLRNAMHVEQDAHALHHLCVIASRDCKALSACLIRTA